MPIAELIQQIDLVLRSEGVAERRSRLEALSRQVWVEVFPDVPLGEVYLIPSDEIRRRWVPVSAMIDQNPNKADISVVVDWPASGGDLSRVGLPKTAGKSK